MKGSVAATVLISALGTALMSAAVAAPVSYTIDSRHTYPTFEVNHHGFSIQRGRFDKTSGKLTLDMAAKSGSVDVTIDASSISMGAEDWNKAMDGRFLKSAQFPTISFKSSKFKFEGDHLVAVDGELTLLGVTRPVTLHVSFFKCGMSAMLKKEVCGADAATSIKRSDFGMNALPSMIGDEIKILFGIEAIAD